MLQDLQTDLQNMGIAIPGATTEQKVAQVPNYLAALNGLDALCNWRETEVQLPLLGIKVLMKPIKGLKELKIKSLKATGPTFLRTFNQILFEHVDFQGQIKFKDLNDFMSHLGAADKQMMVYGLVFATYTSLGEREFECPYCRTKHVHDIRPDELVHEDSLPENFEGPGVFTNFRDEIEIVPGFSIEIGFSTEQDSLDVISLTDDKEIKQNLDEKSELLDTLKIFIMFIKTIKIKTPDGDVILTDLKKEIYPFIMNLNNLQLLEALIEKLTSYEKFSKYTPKFYAVKHCSNLECGKEYQWLVNPEIELFRKTSLFYSL